MRIKEMESRSLFATKLGETELVQEVCKATPRVFVTDEEPFNGHFTASFGVITRRDYTWNPFIGDLWYLHELRHMLLLAKSRGPSHVPWVRWRAQRISEEFDASFLKL